ncbi:MAG TPA: glycosyltransferase family 2 protein [Bryobacteraceae bacterium]|nr:glycosyltransferase family 2 protein [Bryobacteraceae bacterium]
MIPSVLQTGVVITMAGAGSRFRQAGYNVPKHEIVARGRTLFAWSMESLRSFINADCPFYFVTREQDAVEHFIARECDELGIATYSVITLDAMTDGQATTALLVEPEWAAPSHPVAIYNIDTYVDPLELDIHKIRGEGWIPCFPGDGDKWSFAAADQKGLVSEVREKKRISPHATLGLYWFDSFARYADAYRSYYSQPDRLEAGERYIAPLYNQLIQEGARVYMHSVPANRVFPLGTPEDVRVFESLTAESLTPGVMV